MEEEKKAHDSFTKEQRAAVTADGKTIVSASAGAGKTSVMIEKICDYIEDGGDMDNLLAITYTNKAAAQMKERLYEGLRKRILVRVEENARDDESQNTIAHMKEQLDKASYADISTIDSFCAKLVRMYFFAIERGGIDSSFDVSTPDDGRADYIAKRVLNDLFEEKYQHREDNPGFIHLVECFRRKRSDRNLKDAVVEGYVQLRNIPKYTEKLTEYKRMYEKCRNDETWFDEICKKLYEEYEPIYRTLLTETETGRFLCEGISEKNKKKCEEAFDELENVISPFFEHKDVFEYFPHRENQYMRMPDKRADPNGECSDAIAFVKDARELLKKLYVPLQDRSIEYKRFLSAVQVASELCDLIAEYDSALLDAKAEENILDYNDLEHYAIQILCGGKSADDVEENKRRAEIVNDVQRKYTHVFVDEYQDVNPVQNEILDVLTENAESSFFVGDKKQAIYGFRGSKSRFFTEKFDEYEAAKNGHNALSLPHNFRSAPNIVRAVNKLFGGTEENDSHAADYGAMNKTICDVDYLGEGMMMYGGKYADNATGRVRVDHYDLQKITKAAPDCVYSLTEDVDFSKNLDSVCSQGAAIAAVIDEEKKKVIYDSEENVFRPVRNGDICILARKANNSETLKVVNYLIGNGYQIAGIKSGDVMEGYEVKLLLNILNCIDNPEQDVALCAFLLSPICDFTEDDLAHIRISVPEAIGGSFRNRVKKYRDEHDDVISKKITIAYERLEKYRDLAEVVGAGALMDRICEDTGWDLQYEQNGGVLLKSIRALQSRAYQKNGELSLSAFLRYLESSNVSIESPNMSDSDCIHIMTMHSAKGLEFPVVIITDVAQKFIGGGYKGSLMFDEEYGFVTNWYNSENMTCGNTILCKLVKRKKKSEEIKDELNLLYVACTRAKYSLHILDSSGGSSFMSGKVFNAIYHCNLVNFSNIRDYDDGLGYNDSNAEEDIPYDEKIGLNDGLYDSIVEAYENTQKIVRGEDIPLMATATKLLHASFYDSKINAEDNFSDVAENPEDTSNESEEDYIHKTDAEKGTAYHMFLERCDFSKKAKDEIEKEAENLLDVDSVKNVSAEKLVKILAMPVFDNVPKDCRREQKFICNLKASDIMDTDSSEEIMVQGVIDLLILEDNSAHIVDYKYSRKCPEELKAVYSNQLKIYKHAVSVICKDIPFENISTTLVNIYRMEEIPINF